MHLAGLVPGSVAPARLRASGAAPLAAPGGHSLGGERGRRGEREAPRTAPGAGTGIFITPVISLLGARLLRFPSPAAVCTPLRPVRGGRRRPRGRGCGGGRGGGGEGGEEAGRGCRSQVERSGTLTRGARAPGPRIPAASHPPRGLPGAGAHAARNSAAHVQPRPRGPRREHGVKAWKWVPSSPRRRTPAPPPTTRACAGGTRCPGRLPWPRGPRFHTRRRELPGKWSRREVPRRPALPRGTSPGLAAQLGQALLWRLWLEKMILTDLLKSSGTGLFSVQGATLSHYATTRAAFCCKL